MDINSKLANLPAKPGVYLFKDADGHTIYVGKAANLRNRVSSYFQNETSANPRLELLRNKIADLDYILCDSEMEALHLEYNLIKENHPPYNIQFRDDKRLPLIKVVTRDPFPYVTVARRREDDGNRYFGPYVSSRDMRQTLKIIRKIFQIRSCTMRITGHDRVCLYYHLKECTAPCISAVTREEYLKSIDGVIQFLEGRGEPLTSDLTRRMKEASEKLEFERAALIRNQIEALKQTLTRQKVSSDREGDEDYVGIATEKGVSTALVFHVRNGNLIGKDRLIFETAELNQDAVLSAFLENYYVMSEPNRPSSRGLHIRGEKSTMELASGLRANELQAISKKSRHYQVGQGIPTKIFVAENTQTFAPFEAYLSSRTEHAVHFIMPQRGEKKKMLELVEKNAQHQLGLALLKDARTHGMLETLESLKELFGLPTVSFRIEGYDISNLFGQEAVGSMVVFQGGKPDKNHYRKFSIYTKETPDDFAMMREMLTRRISRLTESESDPSFAALPDLILLDGGRGQLSVGVQVLESLGRTDIPILSLAKEEEEIYHPKLARPVKLSRRHPGLKLLQQVRDEAHRFAISFHKTKRGKKFTASALEEIPGIGKKRTRLLFDAFGSLDQIKVAAPEQIAKVLKSSKNLAEKILSNIT